MSPRSLPEWIGSSPDAKVPDRVRLRIFEREGGKCWISGRKIRPGEPWDLDHKVALINGGEHRETNLFPALRDKHRKKTAEDVAEKAKTYAVRSSFILPRQPSRLRGRGFDPAPAQRTASRPIRRKSERNGSSEETI